MASFARGFALCSRCQFFTTKPPLLAKHAFVPLRTLTTSLALSKTSRALPSPAVKAKSDLPRAATIAPSRYAFIKNLTSKQTPTMLYEAPSHFWFYFGCWSSGIAILSWTVLTGPTVIQQPEGIPQWVGIVFGASYVLLGAMGFYLISKTPNIVSTIRILPEARGPQLQLTVKRMVPLLKPKVITTSLENVSLKSRLSLPEEYVPELKRLEKLRDEEQRKALHQFDMQHLLTMPFRRLGRALTNMFRGVRSAWTDMGFGAIKVDGKLYKVDVTKGFAHDGFKTLERIVQIGFK